MQANLYRLDFIDGELRSTFMKSFDTVVEARAAQREYEKTISASWLISTNEEAPTPDGTVLSMGLRV